LLTSYFRCILISRFRNVEISLHVNLAFSQCSTSICQAFDGQTEFSRVFNFAILSYSRNSRESLIHAKNMCSIQYLVIFCGAGGWNTNRRMPTRTRSDDLTTAGRSERRTSRSSRRRAAIHRAAASKASTSQRPLMYAYNDNGSMVDVRCEPAEWTVNRTPL